MKLAMPELDAMSGKELDAMKDRMTVGSVKGWASKKIAEKVEWLRTNTLANRAAKVVGHAREKAEWDARKKEYYALKEEYRTPETPMGKGTSGAFVNKFRATQYLAGQVRAFVPENPSRQVRRASVRRAFKKLLHEEKMGALKSRVMGGAAIVRSVSL